MTIQWYGHSCFKISTKPEGRGSGEDVVIFTDPYKKAIGLRPPQGRADVVTVSHDHPDHNNPDGLEGRAGSFGFAGRIFNQRCFHQRHRIPIMTKKKEPNTGTMPFLFLRAKESGFAIWEIWRPA